MVDELIESTKYFGSAKHKHKYHKTKNRYFKLWFKSTFEWDESITYIRA